MAAKEGCEIGYPLMVARISQLSHDDWLANQGLPDIAISLVF